MTKQHSQNITIFFAAIIVIIASFAAYNADIITIEAGQFVAILFATLTGLLTVATCTELQRLTDAATNNR